MSSSFESLGLTHEQVQNSPGLIVKWVRNFDICVYAGRNWDTEQKVAA